MVTVKVNAKSEKPCILQVYYTENESAPFCETSSISTPVRPGRSSVTLNVPSSTICNFRIDFGVNPGRLTLSPLHLLGRAGETVFDWKDFSPSPDVEDCCINADGSLTVFSEKIDPFFVCSKKVGAVGRSFLGLRYHLSRIFLRTIAVFALVAFVLALKATLLACSRNLKVDFPAVKSVFAEFIEDVRADKQFAFFMVIVAFLGWGFELANFTMTLDDEILLFSSGKAAWIAQGRWTMCLLDYVFGTVSVPVVPLAITLVLYALSFCIVFDLRRGKSKYILFPIYMSFPTLFHSLSYSALNPGVGIGFFLMALASRLVFANGIAAIAIGILLGAIAIGTYQIFLVYAAIAILAVWLQRILDGEEEFSWPVVSRHAIKSAAMLIGSAVLYKIIQIFFKWAFAIASDNYVSGFRNPIDSVEKARRWGRLIGHKLFSFLMGEQGLYPSRLYALGALVIASSVLLCAWFMKSKRGVKTKFAVVFSVVLAVLLPFAPDALNCHAAIPCRVITIMLPIAITTMVAVAWRFAGKNGSVKIIFSSIAAMAILQFLWALNQESFASLLRARRDASFAMELKSRIDALPEAVAMEVSGRRIPIALIGCLPRDFQIETGGSWPCAGSWPDWQSEMIGVSLFSLPFRFDWGLRLHTGDPFLCIPLQGASREFEAFVENMPCWPLNGSIAFFEGVVIIKFTDYLPTDFAPFDGPAERHCQHKKEIKPPVNGFDELIHTTPDANNLLHAFSATDVKSQEGSPEINPFELSSTHSRIFLDAFKTDEPYLILELCISLEKDGVIGLWGDIPQQCCRYGFDKGDHVLRLRVPSRFLNSETRLDFGYRADGRAVINSFKIYADKAYTERLLELNPGMREALARETKQGN